MSGPVLHLSASPSSKDWEVIARVMKDDGLAVLPSHAGFVALCLASAANAWRRLRSTDFGQPVLALPSVEKFERIVQPKGDYLLQSVLKLAMQHEVVATLPRAADGSPLRLRLLTKNSPLRALIEFLEEPVMALWLDESMGDLQAAQRMLRGKVDLLVDHPIRSQPLPTLELVAHRAGFGIGSGEVSDEMDSLLKASVHFVCLGNLNRSAFAHARLDAIMREEAIQATTRNQRYLPFWRTSSSGMIAVPGQPATKEMQSAAIAFGANELMKTHHATRFHPEKAKEFDIVVPMDEHILADVKSFGLIDKVPQNLRKVRIKDPMGGKLQDYIETANQVEEMLETSLLSRPMKPE